jgi:F-type H+-transporting ATPase subunit b
MPRVLGRVLPAALLLAVPALASAASDAGHHGPDWKTLGIAVLNLSILGFILYRYAAKPTSDFLFQRSEGIRGALRDAQAQLAAAQAENAKLQDRLAHLADEAREIVDLARRQAQAEGARMQQRAHETAARIREEGQRVADMEIARARQALREEAAALATSLAAEILRERIRPEDDQRLLAEFVARVEGGTH